MGKITFENKTNLTTDTSIARTNKVIDLDINEIKQVVNGNDDELIQINNDLTLVPITISGLTTGTNYSAFYIPKLKLCYLNIFWNSNGISAGTTATIGTLPEEYAPSLASALSFYRGLAGNYQTSINASGVIRLFTENPISSGGRFIISGVWYVE